MTGMRCTVATCNNSFEKTKKEGKDVKYHRFPRDARISEIWSQRCRREGKWDAQSCRICSIHFTKEDYVRDLKGELLGLPLKRKLKPTAVPSMMLPSSKLQEHMTNSRHVHSEKGQNKQIVTKLLNKTNAVKQEDHCSVFLRINGEENEAEVKLEYMTNSIGTEQSVKTYIMQ